MKRFFTKLALIALALAVPFIFAFVWVQAQPAMFTGSMMGASWYKLALLQATPSPKIVVVGGSGAPYGIVSAQMQEATGLPCVNMGTTAYLGIEYYLSQLRGNLGAGDIVLLAPEYTMYENDISHSVCWMAAENHSDVLAKLPLSYWPAMLQSYHIYAAQKLDLLRHATKDTLQKPAQALYTEAGFGPWGDIARQRGVILEHKYNTEDCRAVGVETLSADFVKSVNRFSSYAKRHNASVYLTYAPFNRLALLGKNGGIDGVKALESAVKAQCNLPLLGSLTDGVMHEDYFYDTNNHLNSEGARVRTEALLADLRAANAVSQ